MADSAARTWASVGDWAFQSTGGGSGRDAGVSGGAARVSGRPARLLGGQKLTIGRVLGRGAHLVGADGGVEAGGVGDIVDAPVATILALERVEAWVCMRAVSAVVVVRTGWLGCGLAGGRERPD